jgi:pilus assembly protein FimV
MRNLLVILALLFASSTAQALGVGDIHLKSGVGEPLLAEIDLYATDKELASVPHVTLASIDAFSKAGIYMTSIVSDLRFEISRNEKNMPVIVVTSNKLVREPTVAFLIDVEWQGGRILRQYAVHLQPR